MLDKTCLVTQRAIMESNYLIDTELALRATPGGVLGKILMGQTTFMSFLQPYSRLDAKNPYPIPD